MIVIHDRTEDDHILLDAASGHTVIHLQIPVLLGLSQRRLKFFIEVLTGQRKQLTNGGYVGHRILKIGICHIDLIDLPLIEALHQALSDGDAVIVKRFIHDIRFIPLHMVTASLQSLDALPAQTVDHGLLLVKSIGIDLLYQI